MSEKRRGAPVFIILLALLFIIRTIDLFVYGEYTTWNIVLFTVLALFLVIYLIDLAIKRRRSNRAAEK